MVDAASYQAAERVPARTIEERGDTSQFSASLSSSVESYGSVANGSLFGPAQNPLWVSAWVQNASGEAFFVIVRYRNDPVFTAAFDVVQQGPLRIARLCGDTHANASFPPTSARLDAAMDRACMDALTQAIRQARPDIDLLVAERLAPDLGGRANPMLAFQHQPSPDVALSCGLASQRANATKQQKRMRYQKRRLESGGAMRIVRASTAEEVDQLLAAFLDMKSARLREQGIVDTFAAPEVQAFFRTLFTSALADKQPAYLLDALEIGGKLRAVTGSSAHGITLTCDFAAFANDDLALASPGDYLLRENIERAKTDGFEIYDLGVGDERYKRTWCEIETYHRDVYQGLTMRGRAMAKLVRMLRRAKAEIKKRPALFGLVKSLRSRLRSS